MVVVIAIAMVVGMDTDRSEHGYLYSHKASGGHAGESSGRHPKREKDMTGINDEEDGQVKRSKSVV